MPPTLTVRLSRFLVRCHPRRWRRRYAEEMLDVLDQHRTGARTTFDLAFSALDAHLDPAWRARPTWAGLRRGARVAAPWVAAMTALALVLGVPLAISIWRDDHWTPSDQSGVTALVFSPDRRILVSAVGFDIDGTDTILDIASPGHPRPLASFQGGAPTAISPDGRTLATINFDNQSVLWDIADPARPARVAALPGDDGNVLWGQAFSPDGRILATAYARRLNLWNVTDPARPRLLATLAFEAAAPPSAIANSSSPGPGSSTAAGQTVSRWRVTNAGAVTLSAKISDDTAPAGCLALDPSGHILARGAPSGGSTVNLSSLP